MNTEQEVELLRCFNSISKLQLYEKFSEEILFQTMTGIMACMLNRFQNREETLKQVIYILSEVL